MLGKRLLVIDDDSDSRDSICEPLRRAGYDLLSAETGREGLRLLHESRPDLVVLDFWLPDMTGEAFLTTRARWPGAMHVPFVLVTGDDAWVGHQADLRQLGAVEVLRKPVEREQLLRAVANALESRAAASPPPADPAVVRDVNDTAVAAGAARQVRRLSELLGRASELIAQGTDVMMQVRDVARAIVPMYAAACVIERTDMSTVQREVLWTQHESAALDSELRAWACRSGWLEQVLTQVAETGSPRLLELQEEAHWSAIGGSRADLATGRALGFECAVVVPMIARRRLFGLLTCASRSERRYGRSHVEAFAELAHRLALALDNAELVAQAQSARSEQDELLAALPTLFQQPVAALTQAVERVQSRGDGVETDVCYGLADAVARETQRIQEQLRELHDYSLLQSGRLTLRPQPLELPALVRRVVDAARQSSGQRTLSLVFDAGVDGQAGQMVNADPERLVQAVLALVRAALRSAPLGAPVEVSVQRLEGELQVSVADRGPCLSAREIAQLSGPAVYAQAQAASERTEPLALDYRFARALVLAHGGRFWAENADTGKTLHLALGVYDESQPVEPVQVTTAEPVILLVDSDLAFRRELQEILVERGYLVETADNGLQAWQYLLAHPAPALILFDLTLPAMDGWELHSAIKANAALGAVPTVVVSGLDRYRIEASLPDAHGYIEKPIRTAQLFEVVQRHVASPARPRTLSVRPAPCL